MDIDQNKIDSLVTAPSEGLNVEIKRWIDPDKPDGVAKFIKAVFAIRNRNGGFVVIGFEDRTLLPDESHRPNDPRLLFHLDKVQRLISDFASDGFEIAIGFGVRDGEEYPVIVVPEGVRITVAARRDLTRIIHEAAEESGGSGTNP